LRERGFDTPARSNVVAKSGRGLTWVMDNLDDHAFATDFREMFNRLQQRCWSNQVC